jgi:hypothetical protein
MICFLNQYELQPFCDHQYRINTGFVKVDLLSAQYRSDRRRKSHGIYLIKSRTHLPIINHRQAAPIRKGKRIVNLHFTKTADPD